MLTWINENAKWVIAIFAVGIALGLLAMDRTPEQSHQYPIGRVNGEEISYAEFHQRTNRLMEMNFRGQNVGDEARAQLREQVFQGFVREAILQEQFEANGIYASVAEMKAYLKANPDEVLQIVNSVAYQRQQAIYATATNEQEAAQAMQALFSAIPPFMLDSTLSADARIEAYEKWLETPQAYEWISEDYEREMQNRMIPSRQWQLLVTANSHPTSLESQWAMNNNLISNELEVAHVAMDDFKVDPASVDSLKINAYFKAHSDSFFVEKDEVRLAYAYLPVVPTKADEDSILSYAMTVYYQVKDSSSMTNFAEMAKVSSEDAQTSANGGMMNNGEYIARGALPKALEDVAFALDSGAISEPVRALDGFHIVQNLGKMKDSAGTEKAKIAHIFFEVSASPETVDSLEQLLLAVKSAVENGDSSFADVASARKIPVRQTGWMGRQDEISELGFIGGLSAYAFVNPERPDLAEGKVSGVLKNSDYVVIVTRIDSLKAGTRSLSPYYEQIKNTLLAQESKDAAVHYLNSVEAKVKSVVLAADSTGNAPVDSSVEKVKVEKVTTSLDGYVPGIGFANPELARVLSKQKAGEWGEPISTAEGAAMVKILNRTLPDSSAAKNAVIGDLANAWNLANMRSANVYLEALQKAANVESNMDLYYRE